MLITSREKGVYILNLNCKEISRSVLCAVEDFLRNTKHKVGTIALNLENVESICEEFAVFLQKAGVSVFGASTDILGYMALTNSLNAVPVYVNKDDFINKKRKFIKRNFRVIK